jgi:3-hydroxyisobutyrate dehydrogenase-like beta-hydroxyacid dehydrogenase
MKKTVGFVGLGTIGGGICSWILQSDAYDVIAYDIDAAKLAAMAELGARRAASPAELARSSDIVAACLPGPAEVRKVFLGQGGMNESLRPCTAIFDFSVVDPDTSKELAAHFKTRDVLYVDTPHVGTIFDAPRGSLPLIAGATEQELEEHLPFLKSLSSTIHFVGARGSASAVKLVNTVMSVGNLLVAAEAFTLGAKAGVDPGTLFNVIQYFGGSSQRLITRFPRVLQGDFTPQFTIALAEKQLTLALDAARNLSVPMPMATACHEFYQLTSSSGRAAGDVTAVVQYLEERVGVQLRGRAQVASVKWGA